jgi:putative ABC transport system substrate-binding protein
MQAIADGAVDTSRGVRYWRRQSRHRDQSPDFSCDIEPDLYPSRLGCNFSLAAGRKVLGLGIAQGLFPGARMKRRELITLLGGAALAWPIAVRAQQAARLYRVGWLFAAVPLKDMGGPDPVDPVSRAFVHGLRDLGYIEGQNLALERRSAEGKLERIGEFAAELVGLDPEVIITGGGDFMAQALQRLTKTVPIISPYGDDPVGAGLVASLAHPGGNVTGFLAYTGPEFETKRLQLLKEAVPKAIRIAFLAMKEVWEGPVGQAVRDAAPTLGVTLIHVEHAPDSYVEAFVQMTREPPDALFVAYHPVNYANRQLIVDFASKERMPGIYPYREAVMAGGLMSYSVSTTDLFRRAAGLVDKIFKGTKPADIPVERPTKLELLVNLKTAKILDLQIPDTLLARADNVIE